jgi:Ala-tRNA(Pro) deacylase
MIMFFVSDIYTTPPDKFDTMLQKETYNVLQSLHIPFERVDTDEAITMEDCVQIDKKLKMKMVKIKI